MQDPSRFDSAEEWSRRIEAVGPASMLVVIGWRMSDALKKRMAPEDIWQETLLHAWRDRARFEWRGIKSFRVWLLKIRATTTTWWRWQWRSAALRRPSSAVMPTGMAPSAVSRTPSTCSHGVSIDDDQRVVVRRIDLGVHRPLDEHGGIDHGAHDLRCGAD